MKKIISIIACALVTQYGLYAQGTFRIASGTDLVTRGGAMINLSNTNLVNDGNLQQTAGNGALVFSGNADATISGTNLPVFDVLSVDKTGAAKLSLQRNINAASQINFVSGLLDLNNHNIVLLNDAKLNGETEASHITGTTGGYVEATQTLNAPSAANPGNLGAIITSAQNMGSTVIRRSHDAATAATGNSINRRFEITPTTNTALNATFRLNYLNAELNGLTENSITLWKSPDNTTWTETGFDTRNISTNFVEKTGIADFSFWTLFSTGGTVPVQFLSFDTKCNDNKVNITWNTATEQNSSYFEIQRSENSMSWSVIGKVPAAGNSVNERSYFYTDNNPSASTAFYRIAEFDRDGRIIYTSIMNTKCGPEDKIRVWPNPVHGQFYLTIQSITSSKADISIYDTKGALVRKMQSSLIPGTNQLTAEMKNMPSGTYQILVTWDNGKRKESFTIVKQ